MVALLLLACDITGSIALPGDGEGLTPDDTGEVVGDTEGPPDSDDPVDSGETPPVFTPAPYVPGVPDVVVDCTGAGNFSTINAAIAASSSGSKIGVAPCTYHETINYLGKSLDIFSLEGADLTIIDGGGSGPIVVVARGEGPGTRLAGFTLTGGRNDYASALYVDTAIIEIDHVNMTNNREAYSVIYATGVGLDLIDVRMENNDLSRQGASIYIDNGYLRTQRFYMACGSDTYGLYEHNVTLMLDTEIACPRASYGVVVNGGELHARRSRIEGDTMGLYGEDNPDTLNERMWLYNTALVSDGTAAYVTYMLVRAENSVFYGREGGLTMASCNIESYAYNSAFVGGSCPLRGDNSPFLAGWNAYEGGEACRVDEFGGLSGDLGFVDAPADFRLAAESPLIDAGNPEDDGEDVDGSRCDIGIYGGPEGGGER